MRPFRHSARHLAPRSSLCALAPIALSVLALGMVGCGQLLGLDEDRSAIAADADRSTADRSKGSCDCDDGNPCTLDTCTTDGCENTAIDSGAAPNQIDGDCQRIVCEAGMASTVAAEDDTPSREACATWSCSGSTPISTPLTRGDTCRQLNTVVSGGGAVCDGAGVCVACINDAQCGGGRDTCGGAGEPGFCGCAPLSCGDAGMSCGSASDGCGGVLDCDNGLSDGLETDIDCGGIGVACGSRCDAGMLCLQANDCASGFCGGGYCAENWGSTVSSASSATTSAVATGTDGQAAVVGDFSQSATFASGAPATNILLTTATRAGFLTVVVADGDTAFGVALADGTSANDVAFDPAGNILVVGSSLTPQGRRPLVEKRDGTGKPLWALATTSSGKATATAVAVNAQGATFVIGELQGAVTFGGVASSALTLNGQGDVFLIELDSAGGVVSGRVFPSLGVQRAVDVAVGKQGELVIVCDFAGTVQLGSEAFDSNGDWDAYVMLLDSQLLDSQLLDSQGAVIAARSLRGAGTQQLAGVAFDGTGRLYVAGSFYNSLEIDTTAIASAGGSDIFVMRLHPDTLKTVWLNRYGDAQHQNVAGVAASVRGGLAIAGGFTGTLSFDGVTLASAGSMDAFFATIDDTGGVQRARRFGDQQAQRASGVAMSNYGSVYLAGAFRGTVDFGQGPVSSVGVEDVFIAAF